MGSSARSGVALAIGIFGLVCGSMGEPARPARHGRGVDLPYVERPGFVPRLARGLLILAVAAVLPGGSSGCRLPPSAAVRRRRHGPIAAAWSRLRAVPHRLASSTPGSPPGRPRGRRRRRPVAWPFLQAAGTTWSATSCAHSNEVLRVLGLVLGLLWWLYLSAQVVLYAAEINMWCDGDTCWQPGAASADPADRTMLVAYATEQQRRPRGAGLGALRRRGCGPLDDRRS